MKKVKICFLSAMLASVCACGVLTACGKDNYTARYTLADCSVEFSEINHKSNKVEFDAKYELGETSVYFDADDAEVRDKWIDRVSKFSDILNAKSLEGVNSVYISDNLIANYATDENGICVSLKPETAEEEAFAWILQAVSKNDDLPYGVFAGFATEWLEMQKYSSFVYSGIAGAGYLTELQFPIYETDNLPENEKNYAWSYSRYLVKELIKSGKTERQILEMNTTELNDFLQKNFKVALPEYTFYPNSTQYEYKITQGVFTYYINKEYNDLILPKSCFSTAYNFLADWLDDNAKTTEESNAVFKVSSMHDIAVYLDDGLKSYGISGEATSDSVILYSVGSFAHEYIHHILVSKGQGGYLREIFPELHANTSKYNNLMYYYLLSGKSETYPYYNEQYDEKQTYLDTIKLYNRLSGYEMSPEHFDYWLFADCYSVLHTKSGEKWISRAQNHSLSYYIARVYGSDYLWELNMNTEALIDGKTYSEVIEEWINYLQDFKNE